MKNLLTVCACQKSQYLIAKKLLLLNYIHFLIKLVARAVRAHQVVLDLTNDQKILQFIRSSQPAVFWSLVQDPPSFFHSSCKKTRNKLLVELYK